MVTSLGTSALSAAALLGAATAIAVPLRDSPRSRLAKLPARSDQTTPPGPAWSAPLPGVAPTRRTAPASGAGPGLTPRPSSADYRPVGLLGVAAAFGVVGHDPRPRSTVLRSAPGPVAWVGAALGSAVVAGLLGGPVAGVIAACYGGAVAFALRRRSRSLAAARARTACGDALSGLADDLRAGRPPHAALRALIDDLAPVDPGQFTALRAAVESGSDPAAQLRSFSGPVAAPLHRLGTAWSLTDSGIPLAAVVDRLDEELRASRRATERAESHAASAKATARLVSGLPVLGLLIGHVLGADPVRVLLHTRAGAACSVGAAVLHLSGFAWSSRIARGGSR